MNIYEIYDTMSSSSSGNIRVSHTISQMESVESFKQSMNILENCIGSESLNDILSEEYNHFVMLPKQLNVKKGLPPGGRKFLAGLESRFSVKVPLKKGQYGPRKSFMEIIKSSLDTNYSRLDRDYDSTDLTDDASNKSIKESISEIDKELRSVDWTICRKSDLKKVNISEMEADETGRTGRVTTNFIFKVLGIALATTGIGVHNPASVVGGVGFSFLTDMDPDFRAAVSNKLGDVVVFGATNVANKFRMIDLSKSKLMVLIRSKQPEQKSGKYLISALEIARFMKAKHV